MCYLDSLDPDDPKVVDSVELETRILQEEVDLSRATKFNRSVMNFFGRTLEKNPDKRSTVKDLLQDSWIKTG